MTIMRLRGSWAPGNTVHSLLWMFTIFHLSHGPHDNHEVEGIVGSW